MGERRSIHRVLVGKPEEKVHSEDQGVNGRIILRRIFRKWDVRAWTGSCWLRIRTGGATCGCGNEPSVSKKCGNFLTN